MKKTSQKYETPQTPYEYTLEETAKVLGVSKERIRQIEQQAIRKMRLHAKVLKAYIEA